MFDCGSFLNTEYLISCCGRIRRGDLMSFKRFALGFKDDVLPSEAEHRYQEYKLKYTEKMKYFESNKDEEWFMKKYHPIHLLTVVERRNERARKAANDLLLDLKSKSLDVGPDANANESGHTSEPNKDEACVSGKKRWCRQYADYSAAPKAPTICSEPRRIQCDIELALALITKLDSEKGIEDDADESNRERSPSESIGPVTTKRLLMLTSVKELKDTELLDTFLTYLWRVHGIDYYGMIETVEPKGLRHVRDEWKNSDDSNQALEWEKKLDSRWQDRISSVDPLEAMTAKAKIDAATSKALDPLGWKYGCKAKSCSMFFKDPDFVKKHLNGAHSELVMELISKVLEDTYFQNYMNDPDDPGGQPSLQ